MVERGDDFFKEMERKIRKKEQMSIGEILKVFKGFANYIKKKDFKKLNYYQVQELKKLPKGIDNAMEKLNTKNS